MFEFFVVVITRCLMIHEKQFIRYFKLTEKSLKLIDDSSKLGILIKVFANQYKKVIINIILFESC